VIYKKLGNTNLQVSAICLGSMTWGSQNTEQEAHSQLDFAVEKGVNFVDTAEIYAVPISKEHTHLTERYIGNWLKRQTNREKLVIASKVTGPAPWAKHIRNGPRLNSEHLQQAVEASLKRLQTDYIDLYQIHWPERHTNYFGKLGYTASSNEQEVVSIEQTLTAASKLVEQGKIRSIGISNETPWGMAEYLRLADTMGLERIVSCQNPYNLLNRSFEIGLAEFSHRSEVGLLAYSPLGFGALSGKYLGNKKPAGARLTQFTDYFPRYSTDVAIKATQQYADLAQRFDIPLAQLSLAFVNSRAFTTATIIGATNLQQLDENISSINLKLSDDLLQELDNIHLANPNPCP
jgi:aryl-alcohol dehydrogenase-like predicted oxidoreductase